MQTIYFENNKEIRRTKNDLEKQLNVKIEIKGHYVTFHGDSLEEYEASIILDAINFGFSTFKALSLKNDNMIFRVINIKDHTRKKNPRDARARIIGSKGKTKKTIENLANADIIVNDNEIGIIANAELIDEVLTGIINLLRGTKQANTYRYLEKVNARKRNQGDV